MQQETLQNAKVLVVDDKEANVRLLQEILKTAGYTNFVPCSDPREVEGLFMSAQPDLILLDLMMPYMSGFEIIQRLRSLMPEGAYLPILVLTADVTMESKNQALAMGATDFLSKPIDRIEVILRINNLLESRFLHQALEYQNQVLEEEVRKRTHHLSQLLHQLMTAQETERRRLSMDIHDGPLQSLGACAMAVDRAIRRYEGGERQLALSELRQLRSNLTDTITDVRAILADLSLEVLKSHGLASALRDYIERFSDVTGISVQLDNSVSRDLPTQAQLLLYRLAQEALANVRKHAEANKVNLSLQVADDSLHMTIRDDGKGFDVDAVLQGHHTDKHLGLRSMIQRIEDAQGDLRIDSLPGKGTSLMFRCPLNAG